METARLIIEILSLIVIILSVWLIWKTLKTSHDWNRRKTTQEILDKFVTGEIPELNSKIKIEFNCKVYDESNTYIEFISTIKDEKEQDKFKDTLVRILNIFEVLSIDMKNNLVEEEICYDYLAWFFTAYYKFAKPLIEQKQKDANDPRVLINFTDYAEKWINKKDNELIAHKEGLKIKGKDKL